MGRFFLNFSEPCYLPESDEKLNNIRFSRSSYFFHWNIWTIMSKNILYTTQFLSSTGTNFSHEPGQSEPLFERLFIPQKKNRRVQILNGIWSLLSQMIRAEIFEARTGLINEQLCCQLKLSLAGTFEQLPNLSCVCSLKYNLKVYNRVLQIREKSGEIRLGQVD